MSLKLLNQLINYIIGYNYRGHYVHAEDLSVNKYVQDNNYNVCGIKIRE